MQDKFGMLIEDEMNWRKANENKLLQIIEEKFAAVEGDISQHRKSGEHSLTELR